MVGLTAVQVPSKSPALNVSWTAPTTGASVTGYTVYYRSSGTSSNGAEHSGSVSANTSTAVVVDQLLADGRTYNISVVTHSIHFSGYSDSVSYTPCKYIMRGCLCIHNDLHKIRS